MRSPPTSCAFTPEGGPVERTGARGAIRSLYVRDPDRSLVEIVVYESA